MSLVSLSRLLMAGRPPLRILPRPNAPSGGAPTPGAPRSEPPAPLPSGGFRRGFHALRYPNYRYYWFGQLVSLAGTWMQSVSQPWLVLLLGGSPLQLGLVIALQYTPAMFLAPLGGVLADRVDKRKALMAAQATAMIQALVLFALTVTGVVEIWHILILASVLGIVNAVEMPMRQAFAAELVPREDLMNAIALNSASFNAARVVGPGIAGVTLALWGPAVNFGINAVSYLAVLAGLSLMNPAALHRIVRPERFDSVRQSLAEGVRYAVRTPMVLWPLVMLAGMATFGMNFQTLLPLFARNWLHFDADGYGALFAVMGIGSLVGSLTLAFSGNRRPLLRLIIGGGIVFVVFEFLLGLSRNPLAVFPLIAVVGLASMLMVNTINVTVQHHVPNELRGRVMSLYVTVFAGSAPIGGFFSGAVAELWGAPAGFLLGAAISTIFIAVVGWQLILRGQAWAADPITAWSGAPAPEAAPAAAPAVNE